MTEFSNERRGLVAALAAAIAAPAIPKAFALPGTLSPIETEVLRDREGIPNGKNLKHMVDFVALNCKKGGDYYNILASENPDERTGRVLEIVSRVSEYMTKAFARRSKNREEYSELAEYFAIPDLERATCTIDLYVRGPNTADPATKKRAGLGSFVRQGNRTFLVMGKHPLVDAGTKIENIYATTAEGSQIIPMSSLTLEANREDHVMFGLSKSQCTAFGIDAVRLPELDATYADKDLSGSLISNYVPRLLDNSGPVTVFSFELPFGNGMRKDARALGLNQSDFILSASSFTLKPKEWGDSIGGKEDTARADFTTGSPMCAFVDGRYVFRAVSANIQVTKDAQKQHTGISTFPSMKSVVALAQRAISKVGA